MGGRRKGEALIKDPAMSQNLFTFYLFVVLICGSTPIGVLIWVLASHGILRSSISPPMIFVLTLISVVIPIAIVIHVALYNLKEMDAKSIRFLERLETDERN